MAVGRLLILTLLAATAVRAEDSCLTGASTLADQRSLATLAAGAEASCACASYTGAPGFRRGDYRRCIKTAIAEALDAGALRDACRVTALRRLKTATCGTSRIACGRFAPAKSTAVSCRIKNPKACHDRSTSSEEACAAHTHCADVVDWTASTCVDSRANGPSGVGVRTVQYVKDSVTAPGTPRTLNTLIWYPTTPGAAPLDPNLAGVVDAPVDLGGAPYPVVMFSHGSCGFPAQSTFLTAQLASHGYIVAAPPHPGNTIFDGSACSNPGTLVSSAQERPQDIIYVLDQLLAADADSGSPFFTSIDESRAGMMGHSFGGYTTFLVVGQDARFGAAVPLAAAVPLSSGQPPILHVPSLIMLGQIDSVLGTVSASDLDDLRRAYDVADPPKYKVEIAHAGHYAFSNGCFPSPDCNPPATLTQDEAHAVVRRWVLPFLERHLRGDAGFVAFFATPVPPGVVLAQE